MAVAVPSACGLSNATTPLPLRYANCDLWLDGQDTTTYTPSNPSNGTSITSWKDKSASNYSFSPAGTSGTYNSSQKGLFFGGSTRYTSTQPAAVTNETMFIIFTPAVSASMYPLNATTAGGRGIGTYGSAYRAGVISAATEWGPLTANNDLDGANTTNLCTVMISGGNSAQISANGKTLGTAYTFASSFSGSGYTQLGGEITSANMNGTVQEVLTYKRTLTQTERETIEGYLAWKWGIQSYLPSGHPYKSAAPT